MKKTTISFSLACFCLFAMQNAVQAGEIRSTLNDQQSVAVTIYNNNLALVKDQRKVRLKPGRNVLALRDVSAQIRPETALLRSISQPGSLSVLEQNFDFDLLTPETLLDKYVGKEVTVIRTNPHTGAETSERATVLAAGNGTVLKIGRRIETGYPGRIVYDDVPANLRDRPTLVTQVQNRGAGEQTVELSYLTGGLSWKADYVAELDANDDAIDLSGWVTLTNTSGAAYRNARLQLVAGDVHRVQPQDEVTGLEDQRVMQERVAAPAPDMAEQSLMEYHLYTLGRPTTIAENQTKQVALLSASRVPAHKELVLNGANYYYYNRYGDLGTRLKVGVFLKFDNRKRDHLGLPLPKGVIRVYKKDKAGNAQFVGEDSIDHTPKNETVRLRLGDAFDVTATKKQTDFRSIKSSLFSGHRVEAAFAIVLKNAKKVPVAVIVREPIPGDWRIVRETFKSSKPEAHTAQWKITVPAEGKTRLAYRVLVKY